MKKTLTLIAIIFSLGASAQIEQYDHVASFQVRPVLKDTTAPAFKSISMHYEFAIFGNLNGEHKMVFAKTFDGNIIVADSMEAIKLLYKYSKNEAEEAALLRNVQLYIQSDGRVEPKYRKPYMEALNNYIKYKNNSYKNQ